MECGRHVRHVLYLIHGPKLQGFPRFQRARAKYIEDNRERSGALAVHLPVVPQCSKEAWSYKATGDYQRSVFEPRFAIIVYVSVLSKLLENMQTMWNLENW